MDRIDRITRQARDGAPLKYWQPTEEDGRLSALNAELDGARFDIDPNFEAERTAKDVVNIINRTGRIRG